jgi:phosphoheptose isomerase
MKDSTRSIFNSLFNRYHALKPCEGDIIEVFYIMLRAFQNGKKVLVCGNGGSASDSEHIVGELMKSFKIPRPLPQEDRAALQNKYPAEGAYLTSNLQRGLKAIALNSNSTLLTAYSNDVAADMVFAQQVYAYGEPDDVLLGISTSGKAINVNNALKIASVFEMATIGLCKESGGEMLRLCDVCIRVPEEETYAVQELHLPVYHALCAAIENESFT